MYVVIVSMNIYRWKFGGRYENYSVDRNCMQDIPGRQELGKEDGSFAEFTELTEAPEWNLSGSGVFGNQSVVWFIE